MMPGTLVTSFGSSGHVLLGVNFTATVFQSDGKLLGIRNAAGNINVYRFKRNGAADTSFGSAGIVTTDLGAANDDGVSIGIGINGKIVVAGNTEIPPTQMQPRVRVFALIRYNSNGTPDNTFGTLGIVKDPLIPGFNNDDRLYKVAVQRGGKILLLAWHTRPGGNNIYVKRYNNNGTPNSSGATIRRPTDNGDQASSLVIQNNGKIIIAGGTNTTFSASPHLLLVCRLNSDCTIDVSFGTGGIVVSEVSDYAITLATQTNRKVIVSAKANKLLRFNTSGTLDASFGTGGVVTTRFAVNKIVIQADGKIIAGGSFKDNFAISRYYTNGKLDVSFGIGGTTISDFGFNESISDMIIKGNRLYVYGSGIIAAYHLS